MMAEVVDGLQIQVHLEGLRDLARQLRQESDRAIGECLKQAQSTLGAGSPFGATSDSGYVYAAKYRYSAAANRALATVNEYALKAEALAIAAETLVNRYGEADAFAAARADEVQKAVSDGYSAAKLRRPGTQRENL
jgi:hypothetical protein